MLIFHGYRRSFLSQTIYISKYLAKMGSSELKVILVPVGAFLIKY